MNIAERLRMDASDLSNNWADLTAVESHCTDAADIIDRLATALRFYADPFGKLDANGHPEPVPDFYSELSFGDTARSALDEMDKARWQFQQKCYITLGR